MTNTQSKITHPEVLAFLNMLFGGDSNITNGPNNQYSQGYGLIFNSWPWEDRFDKLRQDGAKVALSTGDWSNADDLAFGDVLVYFVDDETVVHYRMTLGDKVEGTSRRERIFTEVAVETNSLDQPHKVKNDRVDEPSMLMLNAMTRLLAAQPKLNRDFLATVINTSSQVLNFLHVHAPLKVLLGLDWEYGLESHSMTALVGDKKWLRLDISNGEGESMQIVHGAGCSDAIYVIGKAVAGEMGPEYHLQQVSTREEAVKAMALIAGAYDELKALVP